MVKGYQVTADFQIDGHYGTNYVNSNIDTKEKIAYNYKEPCNVAVPAVLKRTDVGKLIAR